MVRSTTMNQLTNRNLWVDYLRSAITVLVIAHHSALAYTTFAKFDSTAYINSTHPIVDTTKWIGLDIFVSFNDVFFMSVMFFIGGLFLIKSIKKKGPATFIKDRMCRLLIPFLFGGTLLMLIAYFPSYYIAYKNTNCLNYIIDFFTVEAWPVGPPWFIWLLFTFNLLLLLFYPLLQKAGNKIRSWFNYFQNRPFLFIGCWIVFTWLLYVPIAYNIGAYTWTGIGPFDFQLSRLILYFGYFMLGALIGITDFNKGIFSMASAVIKKWVLWTLLALGVFVLLTIIPPTLIGAIKSGRLKPFYSWMIYYTIYVVSCTLSSIMFLSIFRKNIQTEKPWWNSLSESAYLIYLVHYVFITWVQFALLELPIHAFLKFMITFVLTLASSWAISIVLRKIKIIRKYM